MVLHIGKYWAALGENNIIIAVGFTVNGIHDRFDRRCFPFAVSTFGVWNYWGSRYCRLDIPTLPRSYIGRSIADVPHGRIRKSKDTFLPMGMVDG